MPSYRDQVFPLKPVEEEKRISRLEELERKEKENKPGFFKRMFSKKEKGGEENMARNLVKEKQDAPELPLPAQEQQSGNPQVQVITFEDLIANNLVALNAKIDVLMGRLNEMAEQVGVKFKA